MLLGDGTVGKTTLLTAYMGKGFVEEYVPTVVDVYSVDIKVGASKVLKLEIHDTAGQEDFEKIRGEHLKTAEFVLICYSCDSVRSLNNIESQWLPEVKALEQKPGYIIVGNKEDLIEKKTVVTVSSSVARKFAKRLKVDIMQCSAKLFGEGEINPNEGNVNNVFSAVVKQGFERRATANQSTCCQLL